MPVLKSTSEPKQDKVPVISIQPVVPFSIVAPDALSFNGLAFSSDFGRAPEEEPSDERLFRIRVDVALSSDLQPDVEDTIASVLRGAGLDQHSRFSWRAMNCDIDQVTDSLSDVFLELQSLGKHTRDCLAALNVSMR